MGTLKSQNNGFSLVELMLAMTLSLLVLAGLFRAVLGDIKSYESVRATEQLVAKSQMTLKSLRLYLMQSNFRDLDQLKVDNELEADSTADWSWSSEQGIIGLNAPDSSEVISGAKATSDIVALRFLGITSGSTSTSSNVIDCVGDSVIDVEYEISLFVSDDDQLICKDINLTTNASRETVLDDGVEHLHVMYASIDDGDSSSLYKYYNADDVPDWGEINRVKLAVLLSQDVTASHVTNSNSYQLFDRTISAANDNTFRLVTTDTVLIRN